MKEPMIVMTSWEERIANVPYVIESLYNNTLEPNIVVLTLSREEFETTPRCLIKYEDKGQLYINWVSRDIKVWKKILPALAMQGNLMNMICVDDDFLYPKHFIEYLVTKFEEDSSTPLTGATYKLLGYQQFSGCSTIFKAHHLRGADRIIKEHREILDMKSSDTFFMYLSMINKNAVRYCGRKLRWELEPFNQVNSWSDGRGVENSKKMLEFMQKHYPL